ncbi:hypothetical protein COCOBI_10-1910 [Coccomyxa sp. Obi]|nr:hypothetical protein COCOBI_10-1910 [Coccomyxa sp. Obi]
MGCGVAHSIRSSKGSVLHVYHSEPQKRLWQCCGHVLYVFPSALSFTSVGTENMFLSGIPDGSHANDDHDDDDAHCSKQ